MNSYCKGHEAQGQPPVAAVQEGLTGSNARRCRQCGRGASTGSCRPAGCRSGTPLAKRASTESLSVSLGRLEGSTEYKETHCGCRPRCTGSCRPSTGRDGRARRRSAQERLEQSRRFDAHLGEENLSAHAVGAVVPTGRGGRQEQRVSRTASRCARARGGAGPTRRSCSAGPSSHRRCGRCR